MVIGQIKEDLDLLINPGNLAFYETAEIISIYLIEGTNVTNVFTRVTFD